MTTNRFQNVCDNTKKLVQTVNVLDVAKVQACLTDEVCDSCNSPTDNEQMGNEPVVNIFEGVNGLSIQE